jgi:hypothetical protein
VGANYRHRSAIATVLRHGESREIRPLQQRNDVSTFDDEIDNLDACIEVGLKRSNRVKAAFAKRFAMDDVSWSQWARQRSI